MANRTLKMFSFRLAEDEILGMHAAVLRRGGTVTDYVRSAIRNENLRTLNTKGGAVGSGREQVDGEKLSSRDGGEGSL